MIEIHGKRMTVNDLRRRIGNPDQVAGVQLAQLDSGNERPGRAAIFRTGSGLEFTVLLDRGMDVSAASYQGKAMGWRSTVGDVAPQYFEAEGIRWLRSYYGGLVSTCGLINVGAPEPGSELSGHGLHGRINNTPARDLKVVQEWRGDAYYLAVSGVMRETRIFGENLTLTRTVWTRLGEKRFWVEDAVTNEGFSTTGFQLLYHCNVGWPAVDEGSELVLPSRQFAPRDDEARDGAAQWNRFDGPTHGYREKVYYHDVAADRSGKATAAILNPAMAKGGDGFGVYVRYAPKELPRFTEWKQMGEQDYVVGLEPCTCGVEGRHVDEAKGLLHTLKPGKRHTVTLEVGALSTAAEAKAIRQAAKGKPKMVDHYSAFVKKPGK